MINMLDSINDVHRIHFYKCFTIYRIVQNTIESIRVSNSSNFGDEKNDFSSISVGKSKRCLINGKLLQNDISNTSWINNSELIVHQTPTGINELFIKRYVWCGNAKSSSCNQRSSDKSRKTFPSVIRSYCLESANVVIAQYKFRRLFSLVKL